MEYPDRILHQDFPLVGLEAFYSAAVCAFSLYRHFDSIILDGNECDSLTSVSYARLAFRICAMGIYCITYLLRNRFFGWFIGTALCKIVNPVFLYSLNIVYINTLGFMTKPPIRSRRYPKSKSTHSFERAAGWYGTPTVLTSVSRRLFGMLLKMFSTVWTN